MMISPYSPSFLSRLSKVKQLRTDRKAAFENDVLLCRSFPSVGGSHEVERTGRMKTNRRTTSKLKRGHVLYSKTGTHFKCSIHAFRR